MLLIHGAPLVGGLRLHVAVEFDMVGVEARLNCYLAFGALLERYVIASVEMQLIEGVIGTLPISQLALAANSVSFLRVKLPCVVERLHVHQERLNCQSLVL